MAKWTLTETEQLRKMIYEKRSLGYMLAFFPMRSKKQINAKINNFKNPVPLKKLPCKEAKTASTSPVDWGDSMRGNINKLATLAGAIEGANGWWYKNGKRITLGEMSRIARGV